MGPRSLLLLGGAAVFPPFWGGVLGGAIFSLSSVGWSCWSGVVFSPFLEGAASAFLLLLLVGLFLLRGVALRPSLGGVACSLLLLAWCRLPSPPPLGGAAFSSSSVGWCCLVSSFVSGVAVFPFPLGDVVLFHLLRRNTDNEKGKEK